MGSYKNQPTQIDTYLASLSDGGGDSSTSGKPPTLVNRLISFPAPVVQICTPHW